MINDKQTLIVELLSKTKSMSPPIDIEKIILEQDIHISYVVFNHNIVGRCGIKDGKYFMEVSNEEPDYFQRFILAYQLSQLIHVVIDNVGGCNYTADNINNCNYIIENTYYSMRKFYKESLVKFHSNKIKLFAMDLLMPENLIVSETKKLLDKIGDYNSCLAVSLNYINPMAVTFFVHPEVMKVRLIGLSILTDEWML